MKKYVFFSSIILIIITLSLTITMKSLNKNNESSEILSKDNQTNLDNVQENVIEFSEIDENNNIQDNEFREETKSQIVNNSEEIKIKEVQQEEKQEEKIVSPTPGIKKATPTTPTTKSKESEEVQKEVAKTEIPKIVEPKQEENKKTETYKCSGSNHGVGVGNSQKWFNSESEAISYYKSIIKNWGDKWENFEIDDETYNKNCPYGYEDWSCPYCSKWTINFYYN